MRKILSFLFVFCFVVLVSGCKGGGGSGGSSAGSNSGLQFAMNDSTGYLLEDQLTVEPEFPAIEGITGPEVDLQSGDTYLDDATTPQKHLNPEPSTIVMLGLSLLGLLGYRARVYIKARG